MKEPGTPMVPDCLKTGSSVFSQALRIPMACIAVLFLGCGPAASGELTVREEESGVWILEQDRKVLFYQRESKSLEGKFSRANYVHPLYDLSGNVITEDFPEDHRHQRGVFWTWHQVWIGDKRIGDPWLTKDFAWDVTDVRVSRPDRSSIALTAVVHWISPRWAAPDGTRKPLARETTTIRVHRSLGGRQMIDFHIRLLALEEDLSIGGSEDRKGYGGFSARIRNPSEIRFTGRGGPIQPRTTPMDVGPWVNFTLPPLADASTGVTILCHPSLPVFPPPWILRSFPSMQNPVFPGRDPVRLSPTTPLDLHYRLVIHKGAPPEEIEKWQEEWGRTTANSHEKR